MKRFSKASLLVVLTVLPTLSSAKVGLKGSRRISRHLEGKKANELVDGIDLGPKSGKERDSKSKKKSSKSKKDKGGEKDSIRNEIAGKKESMKDRNNSDDGRISKRDGYSDGEFPTPSMGASIPYSEEVTVDCEAISNNRGPEDSGRELLEVNLDILKDDTYGLSGLYAALEIELQEDVAPKIAGCTSNNNRNLAESKIVNVVFETFKFDKSGCDSSLGSKSEMEGYTCVSSDVPLHIYYVGDNPGNLKSIAQSTIDNHTWKTPGISEIASSEVTLISSFDGGNTQGERSGINPAVMGAPIAAILVGSIIGLYFFKRRGSGTEFYPDTEPDTDDEMPTTYKKNLPMAKAVLVEKK